MKTLHSGWSKVLYLPEPCKHPFSSWNTRTNLCLASQFLNRSLHSLAFGHKPTATPLVISGSPPLKPPFSLVEWNPSSSAISSVPPQLSYIAILSLGSTSLQTSPENDPGGKNTVQAHCKLHFSWPSHSIQWSRGHQRALISLSVGWYQLWSRGSPPKRKKTRIDRWRQKCLLK